MTLNFLIAHFAATLLLFGLALPQSFRTTVLAGPGP
jgi:hypothetical protein